MLFIMNPLLSGQMRVPAAMSAAALTSARERKTPPVESINWLKNALRKGF
jgi:hypothetical protein